jgi:hypothetical protein
LKGTVPAAPPPEGAEAQKYFLPPGAPTRVDIHLVSMKAHRSM